MEIVEQQVLIVRLYMRARTANGQNPVAAADFPANVHGKLREGEKGEYVSKRVNGSETMCVNVGEGTRTWVSVCKHAANFQKSFGVPVSHLLR